MPAQGFPSGKGEYVLARLDLGLRDAHLGEAREDGGVVPKAQPARCSREEKTEDTDLVSSGASEVGWFVEVPSAESPTGH
jgi:hypothetical protein